MEKIKREPDIAEIAPDNLEMDENNHLYVTGSINMLKLKNHVNNHSERSPFAVYQISSLREIRPVRKKLMESDGEMLSGASVAFPHKDQLFIGAVYEKKFLKCSGLLK